MKPININGERSWNLLVGVYKVLFSLDNALDGEMNWLLEQEDLLNLGCTLTLQLYPLVGILQVHNDVVNIAEGAGVAHLIKLPVPSCECECPNRPKN